MRSSLWRVAALGLLAAASPEALATLVEPVPLERMAREAEVIVHARVLGQRVTWDDERARILTLTEIEVLDAVKGARKGETITIYQVGGSLDGVTFAVPGALVFRPGEEIVFFAVRFGEMVASYGMGLGKFVVVDGPSGKEVVPDFGQVVFVRRTPDGRLAPADPPDTERQELGAFLERVRKLAHGVER